MNTFQPSFEIMLNFEALCEGQVLSFGQNNLKLGMKLECMLRVLGPNPSKFGTLKNSKYPKMLFL